MRPPRRDARPTPEGCQRAGEGVRFIPTRTLRLACSGSSSHPRAGRWHSLLRMSRCTPIGPSRRRASARDPGREREPPPGGLPAPAGTPDRTARSSTMRWRLPSSDLHPTSADGGSTLPGPDPPVVVPVLALDGPRNLSVERDTRGQDRRDERDDRNEDRSAHDQRDISWTARKSRLARRVRGGYVVSIALMQSTTRRAPRGGARSGAARERADVSNCSAAGNFAPPASVARPSTTGG